MRREANDDDDLAASVLDEFNGAVGVMAVENKDTRFPGFVSTRRPWTEDFLNPVDCVLSVGPSRLGDSDAVREERIELGCDKPNKGGTHAAFSGLSANHDA